MRLDHLTAILSRPATLLTGSFLLVAGAIVTNALFLQPQRHPAPFMVTRAAPGPAAMPAPATTALAETPAAQRADDLVLAVQSALRRLGYYAGPLDGIAGPQTEAAITRFQADTGAPATGRASLELIAALSAARESDAASLAEIAAGEGAAAGEDLAPPEPDARVAAVQHALAISAYGPLSADGFMGPETEEAILRFQRDRGLAPTGEISDALVLELRSMGALQD